MEFLGRRLTDLMRTPREAVAAELGSRHPNNIAAVINATSGLNIVAQSLPLKPGDQILTTDHEYSALEKTWPMCARKTGAEVVVGQGADAARLRGGLYRRRSSPG